MRRVHFVEIHEQPWCPRVIRDAATALLGFAATVGRQYDRAVPRLRAAIEAAGADHVLDLCSGGGGPWTRLERVLNRDRQPPLRIVLSDLFPPRDASSLANGHIDYCRTPVDATRTPPNLVGFRTLFTSFHHFRPEKAQAILSDAAGRGHGIAVFEQTARTLHATLFMLVLPILAFAAAPFVRPFLWKHFFWTCPLPVVPLVLGFDGVVSCLRSYTLDELRQMVRSVGSGAVDSARSYVWDVGRLRAPLSGLDITYVIGYPKPETSAG